MMSPIQSPCVPATCFPPSPRRSRFLRRGFSLVEMLVVLGLIILLIAVLLPAAGRARGQARMTNCASQLRQIYFAAATWKTAHDPQPLQAEGWRATYKPIVQNLTIYNCPDSNQADLTSADVAAGPSDQAGSSNSTNPTNLPDLSTAFFHVDTTGWDCPMTPGPWVRQSNVTATGYDLGFEDLGNTGHGDDWKDVVVHVEQTAPGVVTVTLLPLTKGLPGYTSSIDATGPDGKPVTVMSDVYRSGGAPPGASFKFAGNILGGSSTTLPGYGIASDYGVNENVPQIWGNSSKIFAMDYIYSIIQPAKDDWSQASWAGPTGKPVFARHYGYANIAFGDGSVVGVPMTSTNYNPAFGKNAGTYYNP